jgi:uncharacterized membrane protein
MSGLEETVEGSVPALVEYEQWTRFDEYPEVVENVVRVSRQGEALHWEMEIAGLTKEWTSRIGAEEPGRRLAWVAPDGPIDTDIRFEPITESTTRVRFTERMHDSTLAQLGAATGIADRRARADLGRYRERVEESA